MASALEQRFPHIVQRLTEIWAKGEEARHYLDDLLFTGRLRADRHGFDEDVWMELTMLNDLLRLEHPPIPSELATDIWAIAMEGSGERGSQAIS
jgi:hypothetical protein